MPLNSCGTVIPFSPHGSGEVGNGRYIEKERCGHCSFCKNGKAVLPNMTERKPRSHFEFNAVTAEFIEAVGGQFTEVNLTKFLCGIYTPVFSKLKIKKLPNFGILEHYPFLEVKNWIGEMMG